MRLPEYFLVGFAASGLVCVPVCCSWLIKRELQVFDVVQPSSAQASSADLDSARSRFYALQERYRKSIALNFPRKYDNVLSSTKEMQTWIEDVSSMLGENLRPESPPEFKPEALFASFGSATCRIRLVGWKIKGASAVYTFEIIYSHRDIPNELVPDVRQGGSVGELRLVSSSSPAIAGRTYEEVVEVTRSGKEIRKVVKLPDFRILQLSFERLSAAAGKYILEDAYGESDQLKAERSSYAFRNGIQWEIPTATLAIRDDPEVEIRYVTVKTKSTFLFAGREYSVRSIRPDRIEVSPVDQEESPQIWARAELQ